MHGIRAVWENGQILPSEPVDWPDGIQLVVEPMPESTVGLDESQWRDDAQSIADWIAWVDTIEPLELSDQERAELERARAEHKQFNIEAVRKQMQL